MARFLIGLLFLAFGITFLLQILGFIDVEWSLWSILATYWPVILILIGVKEILAWVSGRFTHTRRLRGNLFYGLFLTTLGVIFQGNKLDWFYIGWGDIWKFFFAALIIYIGYTLVFKSDEGGFIIDLRKKKIKTDWEDEEHTDPAHVTFSTKRNMLVGSMNLGQSSSWHLEDMKISMGVGDIDLDLSRAIIPDGETFIDLSGLIGDINIVLPEELAAMVEADVRLGEVYVFGNSQSGAGRFVSYKSVDYELAHKKVHIIVSLSIGDISIKRAY